MPAGPCGGAGAVAPDDYERRHLQREADEAMDGVSKVLIVSVLVGAVGFGSVKMLRQLKELASQPPRPRQPWELGPR